MDLTDTNIFRATAICAAKVRERIVVQRRPTREDLDWLAVHIDALLAALDPLEELYKETVIYDAGVERKISARMGYSDKRERAVQSRYRSKYRKVLQKFLSQRTMLSKEETKNFLKILDPDAMVSQ